MPEYFEFGNKKIFDSEEIAKEFNIFFSNIGENLAKSLHGPPNKSYKDYLQKNFRKMRNWVGKTATFTYFERTKANSYRHPLFKCIRDYE